VGGDSPPAFAIDSGPDTENRAVLKKEGSRPLLAPLRFAIGSGS